MDKSVIEKIISDIMINDGPDSHCDGADVITEFVESLLSGKSDEWVSEYFKTKDKYYYEDEN